MEPDPEGLLFSRGNILIEGRYAMFFDHKTWGKYHFVKILSIEGTKCKVKCGNKIWIVPKNYLWGESIKNGTQLTLF